MKADAVVQLLADTLANMNTETLSKTLPETKAKPLVDALGEMPSKVDPETLRDTLAEVKLECLGLHLSYRFQSQPEHRLVRRSSLRPTCRIVSRSPHCTVSARALSSVSASTCARVSSRT